MDIARNGALSSAMKEETGSWYYYSEHRRQYVAEGSPASEYAELDHKEDFAEAVAAYVYPDAKRYTKVFRMDKTRSDYVERAFCEEYYVVC